MSTNSNRIPGKLGFKNKHRPRPRWSHQNDLESLVGKTVLFSVSGSEQFKRGELLAADQFTVKIRQGDDSIIVLFKSALISFQDISE